jgi:hypothetical protein
MILFCRYVLTMIFICCLAGCEKFPDISERPSEEDTESSFVPYEYDNDYPYPYWKQDWRSGTWQKAEQYDAQRECTRIRNKLTNDLFYISIGDPWMEYTRIIDPKLNQQKYIEYDIYVLPRGYYESFPFKNQYPLKWWAAETIFCAEKIFNGYILVIAYEHNLYLIKFVNYLEDTLATLQPKYTVGIATVEGTPLEVDLEGLQWQQEEIYQKISFADRDIDVSIAHQWTSNKDEADISSNGKDYIFFYRLGYDFSYGGYPGNVYREEGEPLRKPAHIAIIPSDYLQDNSIIDLAKFRFKTWEDGLGIYGESPE